MKKDKALNRDLILFMVMVASAALVLFYPREKYAAGEKINLNSYIPASFGDWTSESFDMSDYQDAWESINDIVARSYENNKTKEGVLLIAEYGSDLRRSYGFHFPEVCHRAGGNEVIFLNPLDLELELGREMKVKSLYVKGAERALIKNDKIIAYWLVIDSKQFYTTFSIKLDQMLSGLLNRPKRGFLIRVDSPEGIEYNETSIQRNQEIIAKFIQDLYKALNDNKKKLLFGTP